MGDLCRSISDKTFMYACIAGSGFSATLKRSPDQAAQLCGVMYPDASESLLCRLNVAVTLKGLLVQNPDTACEGLPEEARAYCSTEVDKEGRRVPPIILPDIQAL